MRLARIVTAFAVGVCAAASAFAQSYPTKPVRVIVPAPNRSSTDLVASSVSQKLAELWGQQVTVENHPDASGTVGIGVAAKSPPDGYTLLVSGSFPVRYAAMLTNLAHDLVKDFVPVAPLVGTPYVLFVGKPAGINTVAELIAAVKAKPGQLKFSSGPVGSGSRLGAEKFNLVADVKAVYVPPAPPTPRGIGNMVAETSAGRITYMLFDAHPVMVSMLRKGDLIVLAVTSTRRSSLLPETPTLAEAGLAGFDYTEWSGMWAPAGTPADIVEIIAKDVARALAAQDLRTSLVKMTGDEPMSMAPAEFARFVASESEFAARTIKAAGFK